MMNNTFERIIKGGECFSFKFGEGDERGYFFINETEEMNGQTIYIMCEMCLPHEMTASSFWRMSERFLKQKIEEGIIKTYN